MIGLSRQSRRLFTDGSCLRKDKTSPQSVKPEIELSRKFLEIIQNRNGSKVMIRSVGHAVN